MKKILLILLLPITVIAQSNHAKLLRQFMTDKQQYFNFNKNVFVAEKGQTIYQQALGYSLLKRMESCTTI